MKTTIPTSKKVLYALGVTYRIYDNFKESWYLNWCQHMGKNRSISIRAMVVHDGLRNWFHDQWNETVDRQFVRDNADFFTMDKPGELQEVYFTYPEKMLEIYPKTLLEMIKSESDELIERKPNFRAHPSFG
ncbi:MAG: hypothetical protein WCY77_10110 [Weeksellaceae bacterium]